MFGRFLDVETYKKVSASAPVTRGIPDEAIRQILVVLGALSVQGNTSQAMDGKTYFIASIKKVSAQLGGDEAGFSWLRTGRLLSEMGLNKVRYGDGFRVVWNTEQLSILKKYFRM